MISGLHRSFSSVKFFVLAVLSRSPAPATIHYFAAPQKDMYRSCASRDSFMARKQPADGMAICYTDCINRHQVQHVARQHSGCHKQLISTFMRTLGDPIYAPGFRA